MFTIVYSVKGLAVSLTLETLKQAQEEALKASKAFEDCRVCVSLTHEVGNDGISTVSHELKACYLNGSLVQVF